MAVQPILILEAHVVEDARSTEGILDVHSIPDLNPRTEEAVALLDDPEYTLDVLAHALEALPAQTRGSQKYAYIHKRRKCEQATSDGSDKPFMTAWSSFHLW